MRPLIIGQSALCLFQTVKPTGANSAFAAGSVSCAGGTAATVAAVMSLLGDMTVLHTPTAPGTGGAFIRDDLRGVGVEVVDAHPRLGAVPTITVSVDSRGTATIASEAPPNLFLDDAPQDRIARLIEKTAPEVLVTDAHTPYLAVPGARACRAAGIPVVVVVDATRPRTDELLALADLAISSQYPGSEETAEEQVDALLAAGARSAVVYRPDDAVYCRYRGRAMFAVKVPPVLRAVDPSFADQVFAGALVHYSQFHQEGSMSTVATIERALSRAQESCFHLGPREWASQERRGAPRRRGKPTLLHAV